MVRADDHRLPIGEKTPGKKLNDKRIRAKDKTFLAVLPDKRMMQDMFEMPTSAVGFGKDDHIRALGIRCERVDFETIELRAVLEIPQGARLKSDASFGGVAERRTTRAMFQDTRSRNWFFSPSPS